MKKGRYLYAVVAGSVALVVWLFSDSQFVKDFNKKLDQPISNQTAGLCILAIGVMFLLLYAWLRWGTESWYKTSARFVDRKRAFASRYDGPILSYVDAQGTTKQAETQRIAVYFREPLRIRVSAKGKTIVEGTELIPLAIGLIMVTISLLLIVT